jgi:hypothetical protein
MRQECNATIGVADPARRSSDPCWPIAATLALSSVLAETAAPPPTAAASTSAFGRGETAAAS